MNSNLSAPACGDELQNSGGFGKPFRATPIGNKVYHFEFDVEKGMMQAVLKKLKETHAENEADVAVADRRKGEPCRPFDEVLAELDKA